MSVRSQEPADAVLDRGVLDELARIVLAAESLDAILRRLADELDASPDVVATGGLARLVVPHCEEIDEVDDLLTLTGLRLLHERNVGG